MENKKIQHQKPWNQQNRKIGFIITVGNSRKLKSIQNDLKNIGLEDMIVLKSVNIITGVAHPELQYALSNVQGVLDVEAEKDYYAL